MIPDKVRRILESYNLAALEFEPGSTQTAEAAARQIGVTMGQIAKSILLKARSGRFCLVICPGDRRICRKKARQTIGSEVRMAREEETALVTGFKPGAVCPFGIQGVDILLDWSLAKYNTIYPAAGSDGSGVAVSFAQLQMITGARVVDVMLDESAPSA
jgi:prolyl-tRNA editing enzyme YbaK/EbsC (Cys-tRNA(Pro) deacylase)